MSRDFDVKEKPQWCPGCGDHLILSAVKNALAELGKDSSEVVIVSGIGCGSKIPHYIRTYGYEGIHGRLLPLAYGIKLANKDLTVIAIGGDGDGLSEGGNHFLHSFRYNIDITYIIQDNQIYGLTTGQASPTTHKGMKTKTTPKGAFNPPVKVLPVALANSASFVSSTFAGNVKHMTEIIKQAILHKGFSLVDIYQPCVTWNYLNTYQWWRERVYDLKDTSHNPTDFNKAMEKALEPYLTNWQKVPIGVFYKEERPTFEENIGIKEPLTKLPLKESIAEDLKEFM